MSYHLRLARLALRDLHKVPAMLRLKRAKRRAIPPRPGERLAPPLVVSVRTSYDCNLRCVMCNQWGQSGAFIRNPDRVVRRTMSTDDFKGFIDELSSFKPYLYFTGGEPLLSTDITELIAHAAARHMVTGLSTNGTLLQERAADLITSGLDYLYASLDSPHPGNEQVVRRMPDESDSQQQAVDGIRHLLELRDHIGVGLPLVQVQTILVQENQHLLLDMAHYVQDVLGADVWGLQLCVHTTPELNSAVTQTYQQHFGQDQVGWAGFVRSFGSDMDFESIGRQLATIRKGKWKFKLRLYRPLGLPGFSLRRYYLEPARDSSDATDLKCLNPYLFAQLQPNGDLAFCGSQPDFIFGNAREQPFLEAWQGERAHRWRSFLHSNSLPACKRCFALHEYMHFARR